MRAIILRIIKQMLNDKRSLALILFAPILIISFMYLIFGKPNYTPSIAALDIPKVIVNAIAAQDVTLIETTGDMDTILKNKTVDAVLYLKDGKISLKMYEPDNIKVSKTTKAITEAMQSLNPKSQNMEIAFLYGSVDASTFDSLGHALLGIFSFMFVFLIAGISFIRERTLGTMERFMLTPVSRLKVVSGFILGFGIFATLQSILLIIYSKYVLGLRVLGSIWAVIVLMVLLSFVAVTIGAVVSVFANNEFQVVQFIPIVIVPQIFFSGLVPVDTLPYQLDKLSYIMPVYYACTGLNEVFVKGANLIDIIPCCLALIAFIAVLFTANVLLLKKYRSI